MARTRLSTSCNSAAPSFAAQPAHELSSVRRMRWVSIEKVFHEEVAAAPPRPRDGRTARARSNGSTHDQPPRRGVRRTSGSRETCASAGLRNVQSDVLVCGSSGTGGLEAALVNCFSPGDVLLSCSVGAFGERFASIARTFGCAVESLETPVGAALDASALAARLGRRRRSPDCGHFTLTHNETSTGVQNDLGAIAPVIRRHGAGWTLVDSVSGLGALVNFEWTTGDSRRRRHGFA